MHIGLGLVESCDRMRTALILLVIGAAIILVEARNYHYYRPPSCGRCNYEDNNGKQGPPGPKV